MVAQLDTWLEEGQAIRSGFALKLHALREADDPAVIAAEDDAEQRIAQGRPYEDAMNAEDLVALARTR